ncbi:hypothetical protein FRC08_010340 [Ceratobasidium sp. 394]|nr:hypothetical protein FRC08_010340 [Ceratobasidium sp. 394]
MEDGNNRLNAMKHLRDWTPVPSPPTKPRFRAEVRPRRIPPPDDVVIVGHYIPPPRPSPQPECKDDDIIIVRHVPPSRLLVPIITCGFCFHPLWVGWRLSCGHAIDEDCYRKITGEPTEEDLVEPLPNFELECPAFGRTGCTGKYLSKLVNVEGQWSWQPKKGMARYRVW